MPAKKIDPDEQKALEKRQTVKKKLWFAVGFAALVVITNLLMARSPRNEKQQAERVEKAKLDTSSVLGEATEAEQKRLERVQKQAEELKEVAVEESTSFIDQGQKQVEKTFSDIVYKTTIRPLIDRINNLPETQQDYVREALCK